VGGLVRELGREAHVDEGTLCDLFAGRRRPTFGTLRAIGCVLGLSLKEMICFELTEQLEALLGTHYPSDGSDSCERAAVRAAVQVRVDKT